MTGDGERETLKERFAFHAYRVAQRAALALPERVGRRVFETVAAAAHRFLPGVRATVSANQATVLGLPADDPLVRASTREAFRLYARYWLESFRAPTMSREEVLARFACDGLDNVATALEAGKGVITVLPHMGNWDVAGRFMETVGYPVVSVAEELRPRRLFDLFVRHRQELGMEIIGLSGDGAVGRRLAAALGDNRLVALVADRDLTGRGVTVEMFGRSRRMPAGPATLSLATGAPIVPTPIFTTPHGWRCVMGEPIAVPPTGDRRRDATALTQAIAAAFERAISAAPADWHMFQPAWEP